MIRLFDILLSITGLVLFSPFFVVLFVAGYFDTGHPIFKQNRLGLHQRSFYLLKFRSMRQDAPSVATHLVDSKLVTPWGSFLRRTKLDELPQLINVLMGDMSFVGPRPNLVSQSALIQERAKRGVYNSRPGITGLAQIHKIDMSTPSLLAETDAAMLASFSLLDYFRYIFLTLFGKGFGDRIKR